MVRMRYDTRRAPFVRVRNLLHMACLQVKPTWYDAFNAFRPPRAVPYDSSPYPVNLSYIEEQLVPYFNQRYRQRFGRVYGAVNHLGRPIDNRRPRRTYRTAFVTQMANTIRKFPHLTVDEAYEMVLPKLEDFRRAERNKQALMARWMLDTRNEKLDGSLADIQPIGDDAVFRQGVEMMRKKLNAERKLIGAAIAYLGKNPNSLVPKLGEKGMTEY